MRFWASTDVIHLSIAGARFKSVRSHLTVQDLTRPVSHGAVNAGPPPAPTLSEADALEVDRVVSAGGTIALGGTILLAAENAPPPIRTTSPRSSATSPPSPTHSSNAASQARPGTPPHAYGTQSQDDKGGPPYA